MGYESSSRTELHAVSNNDDNSPSAGDDENRKYGKNGNFLSWKSMLLVLASLPPKQLKKLDFLSSGGSSDFGSVSWDDFHGYGEVKKKLKRLLKMAKKDSVLNDQSDGEERKVVLEIGGTEKITLKSNALGGISDNLVALKPSLAQSLKMNSAKITGIVLHGPSGCGKSYLARIIANEVKEMSRYRLPLFDAVLRYVGNVTLPLTAI